MTSSRTIQMLIFLAIVGVLLLLASTASAQLMLYGIRGTGGGNGDLVSINPTTGAILATIGNTGAPINKIAYDHSTGTLYGVSKGGFYSINRLTGQATYIGGFGVTVYNAINGFDFHSNGTGYVAIQDSSALYTVNKGTGALTLVGTQMGGYRGGMAFNENDTLYWERYGYQFYTVNIGTSALTSIGSLSGYSYGIRDLAFNPVSNTMYALDFASWYISNLGTLNLAGSPQYSFVGNIPGTSPNVNSITFALITPEISSPAAGALADATEGQTNWSETFEATSGTPPYTWSVSGAPGWLDFNMTTGASVELQAATVGASGSYSFDVTVEDAGAQTDTLSYTLEVWPAPVVTGPATLPGMTENHAWPADEMFSVTGGFAPLTWSVTGGPGGVDIDASGNLNGPADPGTSGASPYSLTIMATDANGVVGSLGPLTLEINPEPAITTPSPLPTGYNGIAYSEFITMTGGTAPFDWALTGTAGPFSLDAGTGELSGMPTMSGNYTFDISVTDACGAVDTVTFDIEVLDPPIITVPVTVPELTETAAMTTVSIEATMGDWMSYQWSTTGTVPAGLTFTEVNTGSTITYDLAGTPDAGSAGVYTIDVTLTDTSTGLTDLLSITITVNPPPALDTTAVPNALPSATETGAWSTTFVLEADTGTAPFTYDLSNVSGSGTSLPNFTFVDGVLSSAAVGNPLGEYSFQITVTDVNGVTDMETYTLTIVAVPSFDIVLTFTEGKLVDQILSALGGTAPLTYAITTNIPATTGLSIDLVGGVPTLGGTVMSGSAGVYTVTITVIDANGVTVAADLTVTLKKKDDSCCGMTATSQPGLWWLLVALLPVAVATRRRLA